jgi:glycosyltransferase involved in cell wall biosynthesis
MRLNYIVNIDFNGTTARSVQVQSNASAFGKLLGNDFKCVGVGKTTPPLIGLWVAGIKRNSSLPRKVLFHLQSIFYFANTDIIYSRNLTILFLASLFRKRVVFEIHDSLSGLNYRLFSHLKGKIRVIAISLALKKYLCDEFDFSSDRILVAHDGVFLKSYNELRNKAKHLIRKQLCLPANNFLIMHSGNLYKGRGAELFEIILREFPDIYLVQVGGTLEDIKKWKSHYNQYPNIFFTGFQPQERMIQYQMSADLLFLPMTRRSPIWWCTSPMKLFEYMATGIPILASTVGSVGEILNEENCFVFDPDTEDSLKKALKQCIERPALRTQKALNSLALVTREYTWDVRGNTIIDFIRKQFHFDF